VSAPSTMELLRDVTEPLAECDTCARDFPADQLTEVRRHKPTGKWFYEKQCVECAATEAIEKALDYRSAVSLSAELQSLAQRCPGMSRDDLYEALQGMSLRVVGA
jgi:hypothetical protein